MVDLPVMLKVRDRRCVIVGGGPVATRRAKALLAAGAEVTVVAPRIDASLEELGVQLVRREFRVGDLDGARLVVVATDDPAVNRQAVEHAHKAEVLVNHAESPDAGDVTIPAHAHHGPVTIAVSTDGVSAATAGRIRRGLSDSLDPGWPVLLEIVAEYRSLLRQRYHHPAERTPRIAMLTSAEALEQLKAEGPESFRAFCHQVVGGPSDRPGP